MSSINSYLIAASIAPSTNKKYETAFLQFKQYLHNRHYKLHHLSPRQLDHLLVDYIHYLHSTHASLSTAHYTIASVHRHTGIGSSLHRSHLSIKGWTRIHAKNRQHRPPLTLEVTTLIAVTLAKNGYYHAGIATLIGFHCYLRINEICALRRNQVVFAGDSRMGSAMRVLATLRLAVTKTGTNQSVSIIDSNIAVLLKDLLVRHVPKSPTDSVFMLTASRYRSLFHRAVGCLGLSSIGYTPHSLRHGGCTYDHMNGVPVKDVMLRGRWKSESALTIYVQVGSVLLLDTQLNEQLFKSAQVIHKHVVQVMYTCQSINQ